MNSGRTRTPTSVSRHSIASIAVIVKTTLMMLVVTVMKVSVLRRTFCIGINAGDDDSDERYIPPIVSGYRLTFVGNHTRATTTQGK